MPRFRFTAREREALAEFILSEGVDPEIEAEKRPVRQPLSSDSVERGRRLVEEFGCGGCHEIRGLEKVEKIGPYLKVSADEDKVAAEHTCRNRDCRSCRYCDRVAEPAVEVEPEFKRRRPQLSEDILRDVDSRRLWSWQ